MSEQITNTYNKIIVWMTHTSFICFTLGFSVAFIDDTHNTFSPLVVIDSIVIVTLTLFYILLLLKKITKKNAMIVLSYLVMANVIASGFIFMHQDNFEANISFAVNIVFILLFVLPFSTTISQALLFNLITLFYFPILALISGDDFLWNRLPSTLLFLNGIGITCITFSKLITRFLKSAIDSKLKIQELSYFKQKITRLVVHDLKVPASAILNLSNNKPDRNMREINTHVRTINKQLEDILDIERLEEPGLILQTQKIAVDKLIEQSIQAIQTLALRKNITIHAIIKTNGILTCDANLIERTLINLLINAIKYSPSNQSITISLEKQDQDCTIAVEDKGIGIPAEHLPKIFDKFYMVKTKDASENASSGLGLAFCKLAIQAHKGTITVKSGQDYGIGSRFEICLPRFISTNTGEVSVKEYHRDIAFTPQEKMIVTELCQEIVKMPIYKLSEILHITKKVDMNSSDNLRRWNEKFNEALYSGNQTYMNELITPFLANDCITNHEFVKEAQ